MSWTTMNKRLLTTWESIRQYRPWWWYAEFHLNIEVALHAYTAYFNQRRRSFTARPPLDPHHPLYYSIIFSPLLYQPHLHKTHARTFRTPILRPCWYSLLPFILRSILTIFFQYGLPYRPFYFYFKLMNNVNLSRTLPLWRLKLPLK